MKPYTHCLLFALVLNGCGNEDTAMSSGDGGLAKSDAVSDCIHNDSQRDSALLPDVNLDAFADSGSADASDGASSDSASSDVVDGDGIDARLDVKPDVAIDSSSDAMIDTGPDAVIDSGPDVVIDSGPDVVIDAKSDVVIDSTPDVSDSSELDANELDSPLDSLTDSSTDSGSIVIRGGTFYRSYDGITHRDMNYPATVDGFRLDIYEVTVSRFRAFVSGYPANLPLAGTGKNPSNSLDPGWQASWNSLMPTSQALLVSALNCLADYQTWTDTVGTNESRPINCVTWYEAYAFCIWDGGRLPTEAEWNYAASGGNEQREYPWGNTQPKANTELAIWQCYYNGTGACTGVTNIAPVGSAPGGIGKWGQADLAGNLLEWAQDWYATPYTNPCMNCANLTAGTERVIRGGAYETNLTTLFTAYRFSSAPDQRYIDTGARCARSL